MVLVFHQMIVSALLYLSKKLKALALNVAGKEENRGVWLTSQAQDALTGLCTAKDLLSFTILAETLLHCLLPEANNIIAFIFNPDSDELEALGQDVINVPQLPKKGISRQVVLDKKKIQMSDLPCDDPLQVFMPTTPTLNYNNNNSQQVILSPLLNDDGQVCMVIVTVCSYTKELEASQEFAENQIISCLNQILDRRKKLDYFSRQNTFLNSFASSVETGLEQFSNNLCSFVKNEIMSESAVVLILDQASGELYNKYESEIEEKRIEVAGSIFEEPIKSKRLLVLSNITKDTKERHDLVRITDHYVQSLLCVPVVSMTSNEIIALVCTFNKELPVNRFTAADESNLKFCCSHIAGLLENSLNWEKEMVIKRQQENLLKVAKNLFTHVDDVSVLLNEIMTEARRLTNAERCSLFLLDRERNELVAKVFDGEIPGNGKHKEGWDLTIPANQGIVGQVALTGKLLNIKDTYNHPLFYRGVDEKTGFRTKNVLCFPINDEEGVIGVAELCNKVNGSCFTKFDEDLTKAFAIYCGISIFQSMLYKRASSAWQRSQVTSELMIYHMNVPQHEVDDLLKQPIRELEQFTSAFAMFPYMPRTLEVDQTVPAVLFMMEDLDLINRWKIPKEIIIRFTLMVKRGYRDPPYHNWAHAFSVAHFCYLLYKNANMKSRLTDIERLALFVACLCHDLDHRGTNNAFQVSSNSTLAALYSSEGSVMERHHFAQTVCILNSPGCNIFKNLTETDFSRVLDLIRTIILATDLAHHLKILKDIKQMGQGGYDPDRPEHHNLLICLLMTASDLSDQTKPWEGTRKIADLIYTEFFTQGDLEKVMGHTPSEMMDRERACIPKLQIDFLECIALPVYSALKDAVPECSEVYDTVLSNREHWNVIQKENEQKELEKLAKPSE